MCIPGPANKSSFHSLRRGPVSLANFFLRRKSLISADAVARSNLSLFLSVSFTPLVSVYYIIKIRSYLGVMNLPDHLHVPGQRCYLIMRFISGGGGVFLRETCGSISRNGHLLVLMYNMFSSLNGLFRWWIFLYFCLWLQFRVGGVLIMKAHPLLCVRIGVIFLMNGTSCVILLILLSIWSWMLHVCTYVVTHFDYV